MADACTCAIAGSGCEDQFTQCGIPCPQAFPTSAYDLAVTYGVPVVCFMALFLIIGLLTILRVRGDPENFFVCGRSLPLFVVTMTLASQSLDSSGALGNVILSYKFHFWDGAVLPIGLACCLFMNGFFLAKPLHQMNLLTLPDFFKRKYGYIAEVCACILCMVSFIFLLAGNFVGTSTLLGFLFNIDQDSATWITAIAIWAYTAAGGLFSVAYTDVLQAGLGWTGILVGSIYAFVHFGASPDKGPAYPYGDTPIVWGGMRDGDAYAPFPNAIMFNWSTIFVLAFGNLMALDFQARTFASRSWQVAKWGNILAGIATIVLGLFWSFVGGTARKLYGPQSPYAEFRVDSCSTDLELLNPDGTITKGAASCAEWVFDPNGPLKMFTNEFPPFLGAWMMISIVAASMSTADGAILALSTVASHNLARKLGGWFGDSKNLLTLTRVTTIIWTVVAALVATFNADPGALLIVAFDCVFAGTVVPLFAGVYWKKTTPNAAIASIVGGSVLRGILQFALPKDGSLVLLGPTTAKAYGPSVEDVAQCVQPRLQDWSGVDSLIAPAFSLFLIVTISLFERSCAKGDCLGGFLKRWRTPTDEMKPPGEEKELAGGMSPSTFAGDSPPLPGSPTKSGKYSDDTDV